MKKLLCVLLTIFILISATACNAGGGAGSGGNNSGGGSGGNTIGGGSSNSSGGGASSSPEYSAEELAQFNALFDQKNHVSIKLDISDRELAKLQADYNKYSSKGSKSPIYRMADMHITITTPDGSVSKWTIEQVGVRMKGNTSRTDFYSSSDGMYNLVHFKISFQETFDDEIYYGVDALTWSDAAARKARKNRTFATLEKIDIRWNRNDDTTYIRENYIYDLYREFGVLAPHTNLASVDIGADHAGVWVIYEPIDKIFLEKNLPATALGGDLYKLGWTHEGATFTSFYSYGVEDEDNSKFFIYDLKTNKKTSTHESLKKLINTINSGSISKEKFASVVDIQNFMYYCAVSYMVGNCDDLRNNYNNCYIYFRADNGKMMVIPYDMDRGLGVNTWNPYGHGMTKDGPFTKSNACGEQRNPLFLKTICRGGMYINEYTEALKKVDASKMLTNASFSEAFNTAKALYEDDATPSKTYNNTEHYKFRFDIESTASADESKNMSFADYLSAKRATLYNAIGDQGNTDNNTGNTGSGSGSGNTDSGNSGNNSGGTDSGGSGGDTTVTPVVSSNLYFMSDLNNWDVKSSYKLVDKGNGIFYIDISSGNGFKFKVYDTKTVEWYGADVLDPNCDVWNAPDRHDNIYLDSGSYTITFDANTAIIYIEKK